MREPHGQVEGFSFTPTSLSKEQAPTNPVFRDSFPGERRR